MVLISTFLFFSFFHQRCPSSRLSVIPSPALKSQEFAHPTGLLKIVQQSLKKTPIWLAKHRLVFLHFYVSFCGIADSVVASSFSTLIAMIFFSLFLPTKLLAFDQKSHVCWKEEADCCQLAPVCFAMEGRVRCTTQGFCNWGEKWYNVNKVYESKW